MKKIFLCLVALIVLSLPSIASADTVTFQAPPTAPNTGNGGARQFDLDHYSAYTWSIQNSFAPGTTITGASLTFRNISNWDNNANRLFVSMFDYANNTAHNAVGRFQDTSTDPTASNGLFDNAFARSNPLVANGTDGILLGTLSNLTTTPRDITINFTAAQLARLNEFFSVADRTLAFGFDPDCHFWNNGIIFTMTTNTGNAPVPEPATMILLGTGLAGIYARRRRRNKMDENATEESAA